MTAGRRSAVVLLSGGLDSGTALAMWREAGGSTALCLCADYGQRAAAHEAEASRRLAARFQARWRSLPLPWLADAAKQSGSALMPDADRAPPVCTEAAVGGDDSAAAVWVPARNLVLVAAASAWAEALGADTVVAGFNREEAATFTDNSAEFVAALDGALRLGTRSGVTVASPTLELRKCEIVATARRLGLRKSDFWSCYLADSDPDTCPCESCVRSRLAWRSSAED